MEGIREGCDWLRWFRSKAESAAKHYTIPREDIHFLRKVGMYCTLTPRAKLQCASRADSVDSCGIAITVSGCHCFFGRGARSAFPAGGRAAGRGRETELSSELSTQLASWYKYVGEADAVRIYLQVEMRSIPDGSSDRVG
jgi:hypothetical protein